MSDRPRCKECGSRNAKKQPGLPGFWCDSCADAEYEALAEDANVNMGFDGPLERRMDMGSK